MLACRSRAVILLCPTRRRSLATKDFIPITGRLEQVRLAQGISTLVSCSYEDLTVVLCARGTGRDGSRPPRQVAWSVFVGFRPCSLGFVYFVFYTRYQKILALKFALYFHRDVFSQLCIKSIFLLMKRVSETLLSNCENWEQKWRWQRVLVGTADGRVTSDGGGGGDSDGGDGGVMVIVWRW